MDIPPGEPFPAHPFFLQVLRSDIASTDWLTFFLLLGVILVLLACSALFSAAETALFSLGPQALKRIKAREDTISKTIVQLLYNHKKLLATILIGNNFVNVGTVFLSAILFNQTVFDFSSSPVLGFVIQAVVVTFVLLIVGEVLPKVYASSQQLRIARLMALPLWYLSRGLAPFVFLLMKSTSVLDKRMSRKGHQVSLDDIHQAIDMTTDGRESDEEKEILKGIVNFGNIPVKQIMRSRMDVVALDHSLPFSEVLEKIREWGYSRLPVFEENMDTIRGVLYIKDLVPHIRDTDYDWTTAIRPPYFVPEGKKLDDLMTDFQEKRVHMAIVVDEYGGSSGMVTMEDVMEEIFGEIKDEFDEDDFSYSHLDERTYVFEGKSLLHDICRILDMDIAIFDEVKGDTGTLGGMLTEMEGKIPVIGSRIRYRDFEFVIESADRRRIKRVKMILPPVAESEPKNEE